MMDLFNVIILAYAQNKGRTDELGGRTFSSMTDAFYLGAGGQASQPTRQHLCICQ